MLNLHEMTLSRVRHLLRAVRRSRGPYTAVERRWLIGVIEERLAYLQDMEALADIIASGEYDPVEVLDFDPHNPDHVEQV